MRGPWAIMGDFNDISHQYKKKGGGLKDERCIRGFQSLVYDLQLFDCGFKGHPFTWNNKREGDGLVMKRLDRMLCNNEWSLAFPRR